MATPMRRLRSPFPTIADALFVEMQSHVPRGSAVSGRVAHAPHPYRRTLHGPATDNRTPAQRLAVAESNEHAEPKTMADLPGLFDKLGDPDTHDSMSHREPRTTETQQAVDGLTERLREGVAMVQEWDIDKFKSLALEMIDDLEDDDGPARHLRPSDAGKINEVLGILSRAANVQKGGPSWP